MRRRSALLTVAVAALFMLVSACGTDTDAVVDAVGSSTTTADDGATSTTTADDDDDGTTTSAPTTTTARAADPEAEPYLEAMTASMLADGDAGITEDQARCYAGHTLDVIGLDRLQQHDISPDAFADEDDAMDFSELGITMDEGNAIFDGFTDCGIDLDEMIAAGFAEDEELDPKAKACLEQVLTEENLRLLIVTSMVKGEDAMETDPELEAITSGMIGCAFMAMGSETD